MQKPNINAKMWQDNIKKLSARLTNNSITVLLSPHQNPRSLDIYFPFRQDSNILYLCGLNLKNTALVILKLNNNYESLIFTKTNANR